MVGAGLAVVSDNLEAANHLTDGEESEAFSGYNTTGDELCVADVAGQLEQVLGSLEQCAILERVPQVLIDVLEGGKGAGNAAVSALCIV